MFEAPIRKIPKIGSKIIDYHTSSNSLFARGNGLENTINHSFKLFKTGHESMKSRILDNSHRKFWKMLEHAGLGIYDTLSMGVSAATVVSYLALEAASRLSETATRFTAKALDAPGSLIEKKNPNSYLGNFHNLTSKLVSKTSDFFNNSHTFRFKKYHFTLGKDYFKIPKDLAIVALSLGLTYNVLTTNYSKLGKKISNKLDEVSYNIENTVDENIFSLTNYFNRVLPDKADSYRDESCDLGIRVGGSKHTLVKGDILDIDLSFNTFGDLSPTDTLVAKYFAISEKADIPKVGDWWFKKDMIPLGKREFIAGEGVSGFFTYNPDLDKTFNIDGSDINPFASNDADTTAFEFAVMVYKNGKKLTHKFWGENFKKRIREGAVKLDNLSFKFKKSIDDLVDNKDLIDNKITDVIGVDDKKVFIYIQKLGSKYLRDDILTTADYVMPHYWDVHSFKKNHISRRVSTRFMKSYINLAHSKDTKVLPMFSAFKKSYIINILDDPLDFSKQIVSNVKKIGADGVTIDLESTKVGSARSEQLVQFMKILKGEFNKEEKLSGKNYEIAIAVSPRFYGSSTHGYSHHGFYNIGELDTISNVNWIHIMAYDFNVRKKGPGLPESKIDPIANFAIQNMKNDYKIVLCAPYYGIVFDGKGRRIGPINERNNFSYLSRHGAKTQMSDGELLITTKNPSRYVYTQNPEVHRARLFKIDTYKGKIRAVGGWRGSYTTVRSLRQYQAWKQRKF